jgi:pSer/pThr/pTyr-binding forkhead associated (FHA) protein
VEERRIELRLEENEIGRDTAAIVRLDSPAVSRRHTRIIVDGVGIRLEDLGKNGTKIGDRRVIGECSLRDGDSIIVGATRLLYRTAADGGTTETVNPPAR